MSRAEQTDIAAADWLIAQADGPLTPEQEAEFAAWFNASAGNKAAYWRLQHSWEQADAITALAEKRRADRPRSRFATRRWIPAAIAASIALVLGFQHYGGSWRAVMSPQTEVSNQAATQSYATASGERHLVGLPDGSTIQLGTLSKVHTRLSPQRREVWLDQGEAFFEVAHSADRPFVVHAGDRRVTVLGTKFSVRRDSDRLVVAVLEGRVELAELEQGNAIRSSTITRGEIAIATGRATFVSAPSVEKVSQALAWRDGMLSFEHEPLSIIVQEFNRHNTRKLVLEGSSVGSMRITGTFPSDQPDAFARLLRQAYALDIEETEERIVVSR